MEAARQDSDGHIQPRSTFRKRTASVFVLYILKPDSHGVKSKKVMGSLLARLFILIVLLQQIFYLDPDGRQHYHYNKNGSS
jgi:hypothetical protein